MAVKLLQASFRGVPFHVSSVELEAGRRTVVHEYPQRDKPYVEDIGRATRKVSFTAFLVGDDYITQAQAFIAAVEKKGPGTLVHPHLGEMRATVTAVSTIKFDTKQRVAEVKLVATEAGELEFPKTGKDGVSAAFEAADALQVSAIQQFCDSIDLSSVSEWVDRALAGDLLDAIGVVSSSDLAAVFDKVDELSDLASKGVSLISKDPRVFAEKMMGALGLSRVASSSRAWSGVAKQLKNVVGDEKLSSGTKRLAIVIKDSVVQSDPEAAVLRNRAAVETLIRQGMLAQMVGVSAFVGSSADTVDEVSDDVSTGEALRETIAKSYDDIVAVRSQLLTVIDEELLMTTNDDAYLALERARVAVFDVLTDRANSHGKLIVVNPGGVLPALVHAYDWHDDASRDREIAIRNGVQHEGFCPATDLKVVEDE